MIIKIFEDKVQNLDAVINHLYHDHGKNFLIKEGPDLEKVMVHDQPLVSFLKNKNITVETFNLIQKSIDGITIKKLYPMGPFLYYQQKNLFVKNKDIEKHFGIFVGGSRWHRLFLASILFKNHKNKSIISYRQSVLNRNQPCNLFLDELFLRSFSFNNNLFLKQIFDFITALPLEVTNEENDNTGFIEYFDAFNISHLYEKIFVDVVCETWHEGHCFYPTEKIARAIVCHTPFLVYGGKNFLKNLHHLGFKTFNDFWDESYDNFSGVDRIVRINKIIKRISNLSIYEIKQLYQKIQEILNHNYENYNSLNSNKFRGLYR